MKKSWKLISLTLGIIFDILFWKKKPGISFAIFISMCLIAGTWLSRSEKIPFSLKNIFLLVTILFFSMMTFIRQDILTTLLNTTLAVFTTGILTITFQSGRWISYGLIDYVKNFFALTGSILSFPFFISSPGNSEASADHVKDNRTGVWPILRGIALAIPILLVFTLLFSSADLVFRQNVDSIIDNLHIENITLYTLRVILILLIANMMAGIFSHATLKNPTKNTIGMDQPAIKPFLGFTEASIVLGSVLGLFLSFIAVQFEYFFFSKHNISAVGFTYAEYARRGFGELIAAACFSLILLLCMNVITHKSDLKQKKIFSTLNIGVAISVLIYLLSAFQRLLLYESAYGFSQLRTYAHVFMVWLGLLLIAVVIIEIINQPGKFVNIALLVLIGFTATLDVLNVDAFITLKNIGRMSSGSDLDVSYLTSLTNDAVPSAVEAFSSTQPLEKTHEDIGAALVCFQARLNEDKTNHSAWQSFHLADWKASRALKEVKGQLKSYQIDSEDWTWMVTGPSGKVYACQDFLKFD